MKNKKRILVFSEAERAITATAIKDAFADYSEPSEIILIDIMELRNKPLVDFFSNLLSVDINVDKIGAKIKKRMTYRNINRILKPDLSVKNISSYRNMENILLRYIPDLVILVGTGAVMEVCALRNKLSLEFKILTVVDDYVLNKNLIYEYVDAYLVENIGIKTDLVNNYVPEGKIHLTSLPVMNIFMKKFSSNKAQMFDSTLPILTLVVAPNDKEQFKWQLDVLAKYREKYNVYVFIDGNNAAIEKASSHGFKIVNDYPILNELYWVSEILLICPYSALIEPAFLKEKLIALSAPNNELEFEVFKALNEKTIPCENEHRLTYFLDKYPREEYRLIQANSKKQLHPLPITVFEKFL